MPTAKWNGAVLAEAPASEIQMVGMDGVVGNVDSADSLFELPILNSYYKYRHSMRKVEGNVYFPPSAVNKQFFRDSDHHTTCGWKGLCSYYHVEVDGKKNENAAWCVD